MSFAEFAAAADDVVSRARRREAPGLRLRGDDGLADQPRDARHDRVRPASDAGAGPHRRDRRDRVPGGVLGDGAGNPLAAGDQQGRHVHVDLRPPDHPGRGVGRFSGADRGASARASTASTSRSSRTSGFPTSRSTGRSTATRLFGRRDEIEKQARVLELINAYRVRGHLIADIDPLRMEPVHAPSRARPGDVRADDLGPRPRVLDRRPEGRRAHAPAGNHRGHAPRLLRQGRAPSTASSPTRSRRSGSGGASARFPSRRPARSGAGSSRN